MCNPSEREEIDKVRPVCPCVRASVCPSVRTHVPQDVPWTRQEVSMIPLCTHVRSKCLHARNEARATRCHSSVCALGVCLPTLPANPSHLLLLPGRVVRVCMCWCLSAWIQQQQQQQQPKKVIMEAEKSLVAVLSQPKGRVVLEETAKQNECVCPSVVASTYPTTRDISFMCRQPWSTSHAACCSFFIVRVAWRTPQLGRAASDTGNLRTTLPPKSSCSRNENPIIA